MAAYVLDLSFIPTEAMTQFYCVKMGTETASGRTVDLNDAQGEAGIIGFVQETISAADVANGRVANVRCAGVTRAVCDTALTAGTWVTASGVGKVEPAATGDFAIGICLLSTAADGDQTEVLIMPQQVASA